MSVSFSLDGPEAANMAVVGYTIGRSHGGAVERNRLRRRLREAVRASGPELPLGAYLVRAEPSAAGVGFAELRRTVRAAALAAAAPPGGREPPGGRDRGAR